MLVWVKISVKFTLTKLALISYSHEELFIENGETTRNSSKAKILSNPKKLKLLKINRIRYNSFEQKEGKSLKSFVFLQLNLPPVFFQIELRDESLENIEKSILK